MLHKVERLLKQQPKDSHKLYSLHAPEAECIAKGKVRQPYEFGVKVSVATTHKEGLVVGMCSLPGNPYDGHTLHAALQQVEILTQRPSRRKCSWTWATEEPPSRLESSSTTANSNAASVRGLSGTFGDAAPLNQQSGT